MLIPLNLPHFYDLALSIVFTKDKLFSINLVSINNSPKLNQLPSYYALFDVNALNNRDEFEGEIDLVVSFVKRLAKDPDLYKALEIAIDVIKQEYL